MKDAKLRQAIRAAQAVRDAAGDTGATGFGERYADRQIFETTNELMPASIEYTTRPSGLEDARAAQHLPFTASPYAGVHANSMDDVDRSENPDAPVLEAQFNGQGVPFTPPSAANTSTMMGRNARRSSGTRAGDASSVHNRIPLP